jgi:hypothetical protein
MIQALSEQPRATVVKGFAQAGQAIAGGGQPPVEFVVAHGRQCGM